MNKQDKWMPPKPEFFMFQHSYPTMEYITKDHFNEWYDKVFENAVEVLGHGSQRFWHKDSTHLSDEPTHKALLINITPIKESAEDILKELMDTLVQPSGGSHVCCHRKYIEKAKAFLEKKK